MIKNNVIPLFNDTDTSLHIQVPNFVILKMRLFNHPVHRNSIIRPRIQNYNFWDKNVEGVVKKKRAPKVRFLITYRYTVRNTLISCIYKMVLTKYIFA